MGASFGTPPQLPDIELKGKTIIVTGANTGIGYETAKTLAQLGSKVILACRSEEKANQAIQRMKEEHIQERSSEKDAKIIIKADELDVEFMPLDLGSLASTVTFAKEYKAKGYSLHVLLCNAGMAWGPDEPTADGFEIHFQVNYLSHFLLILYLLPVLKATGNDTRIVLISSLMHRFSKWDPHDIQCFNEKDKMTVYGTTKLYQIMQMFSLARRLKGSKVSVFSVHPGVVATEINSREDQPVTRSTKIFLWATKSLRMMRNPFDGALTGLHAAANPVYDGKTALYFESSKPQTLTALPRDEAKQEILWNYTLDCLKDYVTEEMLHELNVV
ncbi:retinol dehydrogenase 12 [Strongylocentrotus purpuratus]|uniref:Retinol dehydrogenase 12 n=1 Tax=Strongylocentrotus purpuratus TaxID=7668 RepID=A0A7M7PF29_STRPU|nr:retinol dehydrogenase 12 [Strongylocentrotus purpuratus]XP_030849389.1 retinol dehydrogenase 12 [Strongylocentrotus purpuratus]